MSTAVDQDVRDRAISGTSTSMALSAGAGSGKTSVLTARILAQLEAGTPPARLAAITFTEKAAGELQARVRDALEARLQQRPDPRLEQALTGLPDLTLSTIHSFCRRLLTLEALEAGWAPTTEVVPDVEQAEPVAAAWRAWELDFRRRHRSAGVIVRQLVKASTLRAGAMKLLAFRDLDPVVHPLPFAPEAAFAGLQEVHARLEQAAEACLVPDADKLLQGNAALRALLADAVRREPVDAVVHALLSSEAGKRSGGKKGDWVADGKQVFLEALVGWQDWRAGQLARLHGLVVGDLHERLLPAVEAAKGAAAVADYDDLLFRAATVLSDAGVRARLAGRFDALLIDEVQDTDPIQAEVAALLTRAPDADGPWDAHPPRPGHLFAVGDPRQSIYRFRRADVETWGALRSLVARDGELLSLTQNFRSVPGLVDWVNDAFADLPGYVAQQAFREPAHLPPVVRLIPGELDELDAVARHLLSLRESGHVVDRETGERRAVRWSDVMVLLPAWSRSEAVQETLTRAGVPCVVEGGSAFVQRDEVRLGIAALRCLEEPSDERATVLVLRGLFGLTWEALGRHRAAGGAWRYTVPDPPPGPVAEAFSLLRELSRSRGRRSWVALLDELLERTRAAATWVALRDGEARLANLDKLRALLRRLEATARSPGEVLRQLDALDHEKDLSRVDLDSDAVRITSYFKAKGLEAPIVVICCASRKRDGVEAVVDRKTRQVALKIGELVPRDWAAHEEREKGAMEAERRRWIYVATTRARDHLVLVDAGRSLLTEHVARGLAAAEAVQAEALPVPPWRDETFPGVDPSVDGWLEAPPDAEPDPTEAFAEARLAAVRKSRAGCTRWRSVQEVACRERVRGRSSAVGVVGGRLVHDVMEALDLGMPEEALLSEVEPLVGALAAGLGVDEETAEVCADIVRGMLRHPVLARARQAPERWAEVPFSIRDKGRVVSGRIDLAFPTDASRRHWVVVDWKSDLPAHDTPGWRNYERQLGWYAKALLKTVSPCEEVETVLVGPHAALPEAIDAADLLADALDELVPGLVALLDAARRAGHPLPIPSVGADVGEPIVAQAEVAWSERRVALCVGRPRDEVEALRAQGWQVVAVDPVGLTWADEAVAELARRLDGHDPP